MLFFQLQTMVEKPYRINEKMKNYLHSVYEENEIVKQENAQTFNKDILITYNNRIKSGNYYGLDDNGIMIRKNEFNNKKSPFGWCKDEKTNRIYSIHEMNDVETTIKFLLEKFPQNKIIAKYYSEKQTLESTE